MFWVGGPVGTRLEREQPKQAPAVKIRQVRLGAKVTARPVHAGVWYKVPKSDRHQGPPQEHFIDLRGQGLPAAPKPL